MYYKHIAQTEGNTVRCKSLVWIVAGVLSVPCTAGAQNLPWESLVIAPADGGTFELNSLYVGAAWRDELGVTVTGFLADGTPGYETSFELALAGTPQLEVFNWSGLSSVVFLVGSESGGLPGNPGPYGQQGMEFGVGSLTYNNTSTVTFDGLPTDSNGLGTVPVPYEGLDLTCEGNPGEAIPGVACVVINTLTYGGNPSGYTAIATGAGTTNVLTVAPVPLPAALWLLLSGLGGLGIFARKRPLAA